ncbi:MAG: DUF6320 domain-containing protein [Sphaerochaeta sp.]
MTDEIKIEYPQTKRGSLLIYELRKGLRYLMIMALITCPFVNYLTGGPLWSVLVIWGIIFFWRMFLSPDIIEFSSIGTVFQISYFTMVGLTLINVLFSFSWLGFVLPVVGFGTLIISVILFASNLDMNRNNIMPLIWETLLALIAFFIVRGVTDTLNWPMIVMGSTASLMTVFGLIAFHRNIWHELKKRFHMN